MKDIAEVDKNLAVKTTIKRDGLCFFDIEQEPFRIYGIFREGEKFRRMPEAVAKNVSEGVHLLHAHAAGGRVRFVTNSPYVALKARIVPSKMPHFAISGTSGFDMYSEYEGNVRYSGTFMPPFDVKDGYESVQDHINGWQERLITINFPLYSDVEKVYVGLHADSFIRPAPEYRIAEPVVSYGSSITQGGCASRPGISYQSILSRKLNCDYINLGFSGNGRAEDAMVDYIKSIKMSAFIMDYDHNAPTVEYLAATHSKMFHTIRTAQPELPIVILSRPKYYLTDEEEQRKKIIFQTYSEAKEQGDNCVYFLDGKALMAMVEDDGTVDNCHPTDSGFFSMANAIAPVLEKILLR